MSQTYTPDSARRLAPPALNGLAQPNPSSATRPLQINRQGRPPTPGSTSAGNSSSPRGPTRPQRSGLRQRQISEYSISDRISLDSRSTRDSRDQGGNYQFDGSSTRNDVVNSSNYAYDRKSSTEEKAEVSEPPNTAKAAVAIAAFQAFGRRRGMTLEQSAIDDEYQLEKQRELEIQKAHQKRIRDKVPGRRPTGKSRKGDIDAVLDEINDEWGVAINLDFNPVELALQLLDDSSAGRDIASFRRTKDMLSRALKGSVDKHYQAFAGALPHHAALQSHLEVTQAQIIEARTALQEAKDALGSKRADLVQLWSRSQTVDEMMRIIDQIEQLRSVPDALESLISEKRLLQAAALLIRSLKLINKPDMLDIGAVADLRSYLSSQEIALREILVDELQSHLYLKSFWCESRWATYTPTQQSFSAIQFEDEEPAFDTSKRSASISSPNHSRATRLTRYLEDLAIRPNDSPLDGNDLNISEGNPGNGFSSSSSISLTPTPSTSYLNAGPQASISSQSAPTRNPEADSFAYMETLLESLAMLGKLGTGLDVVAQKLPGEIYSLVETTIEEVAERAEYGRRGSVMAPFGPNPSNNVVSMNYPGTSTSSTGIVGVVFVSASPSNSGTRNSLTNAASLRLSALESTTKLMDHETLRDLFWTLYSKLYAVAQGLRVVYEVANRIGSRRDFKDSSGTKPGTLFPLPDLWMSVQGEVRTLLQDYITDEEQGTVSSRNPIVSINEVLREGRYNRDKSKLVFRFADTDLKSTAQSLKQHEHELNRVLRDTVPGLVQGSVENANAVQATLSAVGTDERILGTGQHHRLLVHPDAFHVSVLFQPSLAYLDRISEVLPSGLETARAFGVVLDEFVLKVYLPQLEEKVSILFHHAVNSTDAFEPDPSTAKLFGKPLVKISVQVMALINSLCVMLQTTPIHRENHSRLILTVIGQFYQRCNDRFSDLVAAKDSRDSDCVALAAQWAQLTDLNPCLCELLRLLKEDGPAAQRQQLCRQETHLEQNLLGNNMLKKEELITSIRNLSALSSLYHSVMWFAAELDALKSTPDDSITSNASAASTLTSPHTPSPVLNPFKPVDVPRLPLSPAMSMRFQALHKTYEQLGELIIDTIRIDVRCRAIHHLNLALRTGVYSIDSDAAEPDPHIIDLNTELSKCDDFASSTLPGSDRRFVFEGLGHLLEHLLISNARYIRSANVLGIKKMMRNILALQQNLKMITQDYQETDFERAKRYYSLFYMTPQDMIDSIRQKHVFTFDEYKTMLDLQCGVDPTLEGAAQPTDRNYNMYIIDLHGLELENSDDTQTMTP